LASSFALKVKSGASSALSLSFTFNSRPIQVLNESREKGFIKKAKRATINIPPPFPTLVFYKPPPHPCFNKTGWGGGGLVWGIFVVNKNCRGGGGR